MIMWPFGKKYPPRDGLVIRDQWKVSHGEYQGRPLIVRFNAGLKEIAGHPAYRHQVGIAVPLRAPTQEGLPTVDEDRELATVEKRISTRLEEERESIFSGVISTGGMREFVYYTTDPAAVRRKFEELKTATGSHQLQLMIQDDPSWNVYGQFV